MKVTEVMKRERDRGRKGEKRGKKERRKVGRKAYWREE